LEKETKKEVTILCIVTILCSIGLFLRSVPFAYDSYAFISFASGLVSSFGWHPAADIVFSYLPATILTWQLLCVGCLFVSLCGLYFGLKKAIGKENALVSFLILIAGAPIIIFSFAQFQNETLAYPFIFLSFYFLMAKKPKISLLLSLLAIPFWFGAIIWIGIIGFGLVYEYLLAFIGIIVFGVWKAPNMISLNGFLVNSGGQVMYNSYFYGLIDFFLLFPLIFGIFLSKNKRLLAWSVAALVCVVVSARFELLLLPFIGLGINELFIKGTKIFKLNLVA